MKKHLLNKKVLFIGYEYYNYHFHIKKALNQAGANTTYYPNVKNRWTYFIFRKLSFYLFSNYCHNYGKQILRETKDQDFDYFFIIHGYQFDDYFYENLKIQHPKIELINYTWDSIRSTYHRQTLLDILKHFDVAYSFDKNDCIKYKKQKYLPLFYIDDYAEKKKFIDNPIYDMVFIGSLVTYRRYEFIKEIEKICKEQGIVFFSYLRIAPHIYLKFLAQGKKLKDLKFNSLNQKQIIDIYNQTNVILDMPGQIQSGLTMRTIETLGYGLKLLTTNKYVKDEAFFNNEYIDILFRDNLNLSKEFIKNKPNKELNMKNYSIHRWLEVLFSNESN